jgi:hypothetical protein
MTDLMDINAISEFSRTNCIAICAFLVPANLLSALLTIGAISLDRPPSQVRWAAGLGSLCAVTMVLHVSTWFSIGVVQAETFILLSLGATCLSLNVWAIAHPQSMVQLGTFAIDSFRGNREH